MILPLLRSENDIIVASVVNALSFTGWMVYKVLLEEMQPIVRSIFTDDKSKKVDKSKLYVKSLRVEIGHIYHLTADFFKRPNFVNDTGKYLFIYFQYLIN